MKKRTNPAPLPYKGAPFTVEDIIKQQVEFEDRIAPHLVWEFPDEDMRKELPTTKWSPAARHIFNVQIPRFMTSFFQP